VNDHDDHRPVSSDTRASFGLVVLALAALLYFGLPPIFSGFPPAYARIGPVEFGELVGTTCHGLRAEGEMVLEVCK
jgi:hypothetical protein